MTVLRSQLELPLGSPRVRPMVLFVALTVLTAVYAGSLATPARAVPVTSVSVAVGFAALLGSWRDTLLVTPVALGVGALIGFQDGLWGTRDLAWRLFFVVVLSVASIAVAAVRDRATHNLLATAGRFRAVIDAVATGILVVDADGKIAMSNRHFEELVGLSRDNVRGRSYATLITDVPDADVTDADVTGLEASAPGQVDVQLAHHRNGHQVPVRCTTTVWNDENVADDRVIVVNDLSDEIRLAEQERRELALVEHRQRLELVGQLTGGIAHDFNNILTAAMMAVDRVEETLTRDQRPGSDVAGEAAEMLGVAAASLERASKLSRQLLTLSRRDQATFELVSVADVLDRLTPLLRSLLGPTCELRHEVAGDAPTVLIDATQIEQVLLNLASNARDAMQDGGTFTIGVSTVGAGGRVRVTVTDTGSGMDDETAARAFEPFFTTKPRETGTGLGLAMVAQIVLRANGTVDITSSPDHGTTIAIELPAATTEGPERPQSEAVEPSRPDAGKREGTIMVVDDEHAIAHLTSRILTDAGYDVIVATSGHEAIQIASSPPRFDLVLTDIMMPDIDGVALGVRLQEIHPGTQVLFMSGYSADHFGEFGPDRTHALLTKPFDRDALLTAVDAELRRPR